MDDKNIMSDLLKQLTDSNQNFMLNANKLRSFADEKIHVFSYFKHRSDNKNVTWC